MKTLNTHFPMVLRISIALVGLSAMIACGTGTIDSGDTSPINEVDLEISAVTLSPTLATSGDILNVGFKVSVEPSEQPVILVGDSAADFVTLDDLSYSFTYLVSGDEAAGEIAVTISAIDHSGETVTTSTNVLFDFTAPTFSLILASPDPAVLGDTLTISFDTSEELKENPVVSVDGANAVFVSLSNSTYIFSYEVDGSETEGDAAILVTGTDHAGNSGTGEGSLSLNINQDSTPPEILNLSATPNPATAGDTIIIDFSVSEELKSDPLVTLGLNQATLVSHTGLDYSFSYLVTGDDGGGATEIKVVAYDLANNEGQDTYSIS
ncbi:hypothetical protein KAI87_01915, partial [Myxococcota bacterium]|nr:hypothetical protein [Myxococcota bacterium]